MRSTRVDGDLRHALSACAKYGQSNPNGSQPPHFCNEQHFDRRMVSRVRPSLEFVSGSCQAAGLGVKTRTTDDLHVAAILRILIASRIKNVPTALLSRW